MTKNILLAPLAALFAISSTIPAMAEENAPREYPSPNAIVDAAPASEWVAIAPSDLLVMDLEPDKQGQPRRVIIQLMPPPFSQGWIRNIRKLAAAKFWDGTSINRVQDNYVVQWGDAGYDNPESGGIEQKALPEGLEVVPESAYVTDQTAISNAYTNIADAIEQNQKSSKAIGESESFESALDEFIEQKTGEAGEVDPLLALVKAAGLVGREENERADVLATKTENSVGGWHGRDSFTEWVELYHGWPIAAEGVEDEAIFWPVHCYGMVGVGRNLSPDTGTGAELYTVIGHAPRHLDRNIALIGRIIEGMEHLSSLPRGKGQLGFFKESNKRVPIQSIRLGNQVKQTQPPAFEYLDTRGDSFAEYTVARANRRDPFFIKPAGGVDICNIPVPVKRVTAE